MRKGIERMLLIWVLFIGIVMIPSVKVNATGEENPRVLVEDYSLSEEEVIPGEAFDLTLTLRNTSQFYDVYSVVVTVSDEDKMVYPVYGDSNQVYTNRVYARNSSEVTLHLQAADEIKESVIPIEVTVTYNDNYFIEKQVNSTVLYLPVRLDGDLNIVSCSVPDSITVGTKARISVSYENTGLKTLNNIRMKVVGEEQMPNFTNLYNLGGGERGIAEIYLNCDEEGRLPVSISFTYEDEQGEMYETEQLNYSIYVMDQKENADDESVMVIDGRVSIFTYVLMALIVVIAIVILVIIKNRRR